MKPLSRAAHPSPNPLPQGEGEESVLPGPAPCLTLHPPQRDDLAADIAARADSYFNRTKQIVARFGDKRVTYAVFLRRPVISAPRLMTEWLDTVAAARDTAFEIDLMYPEGAWVGAGEPLVYITGSFVQLSDLETILLQKIGPACVAAHNAYQMSLALPQVAFLAMEARHCAGGEMQDMMAYAAAVGSAAAQREGARGFVGNANDGTAHWFGAPRGYGHDAAFADRLCRLDRARRRDVPRHVSRRADDRAGRLFRPRDHRHAGGLRAVSGAGWRRGSFRSGSIRMAAGSSKVSGRRRATRCWNATRPARSGVIAARPNCVSWSAPASRRRRSGTCARRWMRPATQGADRRLVRVRRGQVPGDGGCAGADRCGGHRQFHSGFVARNLCYGGYRRI